MSAGAALLPMRCACHSLQSATGHVQLGFIIFYNVYLYVANWTFQPAGPFSQRSLPSILKIGGTPTQMKVSFAPKSIENLTRPCIEMLSAWRARHKHPDGDDFHLVWRKAKTTSSSTVPVFKGKKRLKAWMLHQPDQQGLKN